MTFWPASILIRYGFFFFFFNPFISLFFLEGDS